MKHLLYQLARVVMALMALAVSLAAQEIGANFNHDPEIIDLKYLKKTPVEWVRTTPYIFEYIRGEKDPKTAQGLANVISAKQAGYKIAFGFRWDFKKFNLDIPAADSAEEKKYFAVALQILERVGPSVDLFKLGNEPNLETKDQDMKPNKAGFIPLVRFTERLLTQVVEPYYKNHPELKRPPVYVGSIARPFDKKHQQLPGVIGLIQLAHENPVITGLSIHLHVNGEPMMTESFRYVRGLLPTKPIIVPEFSLQALYAANLEDTLASTPAGLAFAKKYNRPAQMPVYEWYSIANSDKVTAEEWQALFASRAWFQPHFMQMFYRAFRQNGVVLATYGLLSQAAPREVRPGMLIWFVNPIFPFKSLKLQADGAYTANPLWFDDFSDIVNQGKKSKRP